MTLNYLGQQQALELTRLINCLVSYEAKQDLFSRFEDEYLVEQMNGLTDDYADEGIAWWSNNSAILLSVIKDFGESLGAISQEIGSETGKIMGLFNQSIWSDFIRESFYYASDLLTEEQSLDDLDDYMDSAVQLSLQYAGEDEGLSGDDWDQVRRILEAWWISKRPFELFANLHEVSRSGQVLINR